MDDIFDKDLAEMVNYTDETVAAEMPVMERKAQDAPKTAPKATPKQNEPMDAEYVPVKKAERSAMDRLLSCVKWLGVCGGISMLLWWFEVNGLMAMEAAYPCILVSAMIGTGGVVWSVK